MRVATYNVNGINGRLPVLLRWLGEEQPDIVCLQELKAAPDNFPEGAIRDLGYDVAWLGQKSWNGVALLSRVGAIQETRRGLPGDPDPSQSRYLEGAINGVLAGDFNVMPTDRDVYKPERWCDDALFAPEVRAAYSRLLDQGWTDALRTIHPDATIYTFWDYFRNAYGRDAGLRIDHLLLSPALAGRLRDAGVDRDVRGWEKTSDHAPVWITLDPPPSPARGR